MYPLLFSPLRIGPVVLPNRIVSSAHTTNLSRDGLASDEHVAYYEARARGGLGLVVMEAVRVHPTTAPRGALIGYDARAVPPLKRVTEAVHRHGTKIFAQLLHMGRQMSGADTELPLWAPSCLPCPTKRELPHPMEPEEIDEVIEGFARAAGLMVEAGFDGVEVHAAHGYLLQQFLSPFSNRRNDAYGGSLENRLRLLVQVLQRVRAAVGEQIAVGVRISADEFTDGGLGLSEMQEVVRMLEAVAPPDYISVSQCNYNGVSYATMIPDMHFPLGTFVYLAAGIKEALQRTPVFAVGRIVDPDQAEQILANHQADAVCMTRATICDPELPRKAREGRPEDIRTCVGCNQGCAGRIHTGRSIRCLQNPTVGRETVWGEGLAAAPRRKKVVVVGGGPAGLEAACVAALRGHQVVLFERRAELGGQLILAAKVPGREGIRGVEQNLSREVRKAGVDVRLEVEATVDLILAEAPEVVILAVGADPVVPELETPADGAAARPVEDWLEGLVEVGAKVALLDDDGHYRATSVAELLAAEEREVWVITPRPYVGTDLPPTCWVSQEYRLRSLGVRVLTGHVATSWIGKDLVVRDVFTGENSTVGEVESVLAAWWRRPRLELYRQLREASPGIAVHLVGDCLAPRRAMEAIADAHRLARLL